VIGLRGEALRLNRVRSISQAFRRGIGIGTQIGIAAILVFVLGVAVPVLAVLVPALPGIQGRLPTLVPPLPQLLARCAALKLARGRSYEGLLQTIPASTTTTTLTITTTATAAAASTAAKTTTPDSRLRLRSSLVTIDLIEINPSLDKRFDRVYGLAATLEVLFKHCYDVCFVLRLVALGMVDQVEAVQTQLLPVLVQECRHDFVVAGGAVVVD